MDPHRVWASRSSLPRSQAVKFGVEIGEYHGVVRVARRVFQWLSPERPPRERCVETYFLQRTRFETIAERKLRRRRLTEDGNVEVSGPRLALGAKSRRSPGLPQTAAVDPNPTFTTSPAGGRIG
jgi:hypothetical protein